MISSTIFHRANIRTYSNLLCLSAFLLSLGAIAAQDNKSDSLEEIWNQLQHKVTAGELTENEAESKMIAIKKKRSNDALDAYYVKTWNKLQAAVKAGTLTQAEANSKMAAVKKAKEGNHEKKASSKEDALVTQAWQELEAEIKAGTMTKEEALKEIIRLKKDVYDK